MSLASERELFNHIAYEPSDLSCPFVWTATRANRRAGKRIGGADAKGYRTFKWRNKYIQVHKLVYYFHYDQEPEFIDHINQDKSDNRIENLRAATKAQNARNIPKRPDKTSQYRGVCKVSRTGKWKAAIGWQYRTINIGLFEDEATAARAVDSYVRTHLGPDAEFFPYNFPE